MSTTRRRFLSMSALAVGGAVTEQVWRGGRVSAAALTSRERVERAWAGGEVDRPPISLWHHFGLEKDGPARHAEATLAFHRAAGTDLVKVMSDFPYPRPATQWFELTEEASPFPEQLRALELIRTGLDGKAPFIETIFNPWNVAEKLSSPADVQRLKTEQPQRLLDALTVIAKSEANHARRAVAAGASGIFLAIANAQDGILSRADYARFSEPFDRIVLDAVASAPYNVLHVHGDKAYLDLFYAKWSAQAINYSSHGTGVSFADARTRFSGVLIGGIDETKYRALDAATLERQYKAARRGAGAKYVLTPGCSVPNDTPTAEVRHLRELFQA